MKIEEEKLQNFIDKLQVKSCSCCGSKGYTFDPTVYYISELEREKPTCAAVPLISMMCRKCGHIVLFNAITAGLLDKAEKGSDDK